ncbi:MAG: hypothetical protein WBX19_11510, partial [Terracidiphilus sp.]
MSGGQMVCISGAIPLLFIDVPEGIPWVVNNTTAFEPVRVRQASSFQGRKASRFPEKGLAIAVGDEDLMAKISKNIAKARAAVTKPA